LITEENIQTRKYAHSNKGDTHDHSYELSEKLSNDNSMGMASSKNINKNLVNSQHNYKKDFFKISE